MSAAATRRFAVHDAAGRALSLNAAWRSGDRGLVLFLHGLGCSGRSFHPAWAHPDLAGRALLAPDLAGFGGSDKPAGFSYDMADQAALVGRLLAALPTGPLSIVAHSMGGAVGLLLEDAVLARTDLFVSVEGNLVGEDCDIVSRKMIRRDFTAFCRHYMPRLRAGFNALGEGYADIEASTAEALYRSAESLVHWSDSGQLLARFLDLPMPRHYIHGSDNAGHPVLARLAGLPCHAIAGSGHFPMNDNPAAFYHLLGRLLERVPGR